MFGATLLAARGLPILERAWLPAVLGRPLRTSAQQPTSVRSRTPSLQATTELVELSQAVRLGRGVRLAGSG